MLGVGGVAADALHVAFKQLFGGVVVVLVMDVEAEDFADKVQHETIVASRALKVGRGTLLQHAARLVIVVQHVTVIVCHVEEAVEHIQVQFGRMCHEVGRRLLEVGAGCLRLRGRGRQHGPAAAQLQVVAPRGFAIATRGGDALLAHLDNLVGLPHPVAHCGIGPIHVARGQVPLVGQADGTVLGGHRRFVILVHGSRLCQRAERKGQRRRAGTAQCLLVGCGLLLHA